MSVRGVRRTGDGRDEYGGSTFRDCLLKLSEINDLGGVTVL